MTKWPKCATPHGVIALSIKVNRIECKWNSLMLLKPFVSLNSSETWVLSIAFSMNSVLVKNLGSRPVTSVPRCAEGIEKIGSVFGAVPDECGSCFEHTPELRKRHFAPNPNIRCESRARVRVHEPEKLMLR